MADFSFPSGPELFNLQFDRKSAQLRCALPGLIRSFDPATQTAEVQPAVKMKVLLGQDASQRDLPVIPNVPVVLPFAQGAGLLLTLPLRSGDECLLVFADRSIDNFVQSGGVQPVLTTDSEETTSPRCHSLSDAICIPGLISRPGAVPEYSQENIELRDRERSSYVSLGPDGIEITDGTAVWKMSGGALSLDAPAGVAITSQGPITASTPALAGIQSANMTLGGDGGIANEIEGGLKSRQGTFLDAHGIDSSGHKHTGVSTGSGNTGSATP